MFAGYPHEVFEKAGIELPVVFPFPKNSLLQELDNQDVEYYHPERGKGSHYKLHNSTPIVVLVEGNDRQNEDNCFFYPAISYCPKRLLDRATLVVVANRPNSQNSHSKRF